QLPVVDESGQADILQPHLVDLLANVLDRFWPAANQEELHLLKRLRQPEQDRYPASGVKMTGVNGRQPFGQAEQPALRRWIGQVCVALEICAVRGNLNVFTCGQRV